jgi:two-component system, sensor histidine kinase
MSCIHNMSAMSLALIARKNLLICYLIALSAVCPFSMTAQDFPDQSINKSTAEELLELADEKISNQSYKEAGDLLDQAHLHATGQKSDIVLADILYKKGQLSRLTGDNTSARDHLHDALKVYLEASDSLKISDTWNNLGLVYTNLGDHTMAMDYFLQALLVCQNHLFKEEESNVLNNIGRLYSIIGENEKAIEFFTSSLDIKKELELLPGIANGLNNLGVLHRRIGETEKAHDMFRESLQIYQALSDKTGIANCLNNLGILHHGSGEYDAALINFRKVYEMMDSLGNQSGVAMGLYNIGFIYSEKGQKREAINYFKRSIETATLIDDNNYLINGYEALYEIYKDAGSFQAALDYHERLHHLRDSLFSASSKEKLLELQTRFETLHKEKEIESLRMEARKNKLVLYALAALLFVISILIMFVLIAFRKDRKNSELLKKKNMEITSQKEKLEHSNEQIRESLKIKELFFAAVNHEIRGPLNIIIGYTELIEKKLRDEELLNYVESIKANTKSLRKLVNDILELSLIDSAMFNLEQEPVQMSKFTDEIASSFSSRIKNSEISFQLVNEIPADLWLSVDEVRIRQIIMNLLENSLKFTSQGIIQLKIDAQYINEENTWTISIRVEDTGAGIPPEIEKNIFQPGYSTSSNSGIHPVGYGLGLQIVKKLVDYMNGRIVLKTSPGSGTIIEISIPCIQSALPEYDYLEPKNNEPSVPHEPFGEGKKYHVLIVDDSELNRRLLTIMLKDEPYHVIETETGEEALELMQKLKIDIILLDIYMPVMDGYNAIYLMREMPGYSGIPVIAVTAAASDEEKEKVRQAGFNAYITKPVMKEVLIREIRNLIRKGN